MFLWVVVSMLWAGPWNPGEGEAADELLKLNRSSKWIEARPKAEKLLKEDPKSFTANFVLARALWLGNGEHARAMHHLRKAEEIYKKRFQNTADPPWRLESQLLFSKQNIAGDMGKSELELEYIAEYNSKQREYKRVHKKSYDQLVGERGWPLMKLERYPEARSAARAAIKTKRTWQESLGWNVLCAVEAELGNRKLGQENCEKALFHARDTDSGIAIDASNAANASFAALDFEKVEKYAIEATAAGGTTAPAWMNLVDLYLSQGRGDAALDAMKGLRQSQLSDMIHLRSQRRADIDATFAQVLLLAGETEKGMEVINRAILRPDRRGTISTSREQTRGGHMTLRYIMRKVHLERKREKAAAKGYMARLKQWAGEFAPNPTLVADASSVRGALTDKKRLIATFRVYIDKGLVDVPSYLLGDLLEITGPGVAEAALKEVRKIDNYPGISAYYDAIRADIAYLQGDEAGVQKFANQAIANLPIAEAMLGARMKVLLGWSYWSDGDESKAINQYYSAFQTDPSVFRRLRMALPAKVMHDGSALGKKLSNALGASPRFDYHTSGFIVDIQAGKNPQVCILGPDRSQLSCTGAPPREKKVFEKNKEGEMVEVTKKLSEDEYVVEIAEAFHLQAFGLTMGTTGADWTSLDGSTTTSKHATQQKMKELLEK